jgi:hypothetical protein
MMADLLKEIRRIHKDGEALRMRALKLAPALRKHVQDNPGVPLITILRRLDKSIPLRRDKYRKHPTVVVAMWILETSK